MSSSSSVYSPDSPSYTDLYLLHENPDDYDEEESIGSPHHENATATKLKTESVDSEKHYQSCSSSYPSGPRVVENVNGIISCRSYDPAFLPLPLETDPKQKRVELGLFFDVAQYLVSQKMLVMEIQEEINTARNILANRIACRLSRVLQELPSELERQRYIKKYIKTHIHDNFLTNDGLLHTLVNNFHNTMMETKSRSME
ncbi:hypothetical protein BDC45DRAFT_576858 [Circinella umbellata]|nr:hypothetical protein BDC45DRAFT_576858 [Circinella umbellata]